MKTTTRTTFQRILAATLLALILAPIAPHALLAQEPLDPHAPDALYDLAALAASAAPSDATMDELAAIAWPEAEMVAPADGIDPALSDPTDAAPAEPAETMLPDAELLQATILDGSALAPDDGIVEMSSCDEADCLVSGAAVESIVTADARLLVQSTPGMPSGSEANDRFGQVMTSADFDGDGYADLVVGVPLEDLGLANAGVVFVIPGSTDGAIAGVQVWAQDSIGVPGVGEAGDFFGDAVATGDFDADGYPDLAIGASGESDGAVVGAGAVVILYGGPDGLSAQGSQIFTQNSTGMLDASETGDGFGAELAAADFNGDGADDLVIAAPAEPWLAIDNAGQVTILYGAPDTGLSTAGNTVFSQATAGVAGQEEANDYFGRALAVGHFNNDAFADLAVGAPYEDHGALLDGGVVHILHGSATGITATGSAFLHQDVVNILDFVEATDWYGLALTAGDSNGDGLDELFVGVPGEDLPAAANAGAVQILKRAGATYQSHSLLISRLSQGVVGSPAVNELLGMTLAMGDLDSDGSADLVIGSRRLLVSGQAEAGGITLLHRLGGLSNEYIGQNYTLNSLGIPGAAAALDALGTALAVGDFNGDHRPDVATGIPGHNYLATADAGAVLLLFNERQMFAHLPIAVR